MTEQRISPAPVKPRKPLWRRITKWTLRIVVVLVVVVIVVWSIWNFLAARALSREIARIRAAGEPLTFADLAASLPKMDEADDAGPYYTAALALFRGESEEEEEISHSFRQAVDEGRPIPPELIAGVQRIIEDNSLALDMLDRGSAKAGCNYDLGLEYGISFTVDRVSSAGRCARLNSLRTSLLAFQGQADEAVESAISSLRILRIFDRQPILICHLLKLACLQVVTKDVLLILEFAKPSAEMLGKLESTLLKTEQSLDLKGVWLAERVYILEVMRNVLSTKGRLEVGSGPGPGLPEQWPRIVASSPFLRTIAVRLLRAHARIIDVAGRNWPEVLDGMRDLDQEKSAFWDFFAVSTERPAVVYGQALARLRSARLALMIERYRRENGTLPDSLAELQDYAGATLPLDPFTGKSLIYRKSASEYLIYSLGDDLKDNGGPVPGPTDDESSDWGVRIRISLP